MRTYRMVLHGVTLFALGLFFIFTATQTSVIDAPRHRHPHVLTDAQKLVKSGECWTNGTGKPLPTRYIAMNGDMRELNHKVLAAVLHGEKKIQAFCR